MNLTPHVRPSHWSAGYVGRAWSEQYTCWDFVRESQRLEFGRELPYLGVGSSAEGRMDTLLPLMRSGEWLAVEAPAREGDVLMMRGPDGPHVGVIVEVDGKTQLLHNLEGAGVCRCPLDTLGRLGYGHLQLWRHA